MVMWYIDWTVVRGTVVYAAVFISLCRFSLSTLTTAGTWLGRGRPEGVM